MKYFSENNSWNSKQNRKTKQIIKKFVASKFPRPKSHSAKKEGKVIKDNQEELRHQRKVHANCSTFWEMNAFLLTDHKVCFCIDISERREQSLPTELVSVTQRPWESSVHSKGKSQQQQPQNCL